MNYELYRLVGQKTELRVCVCACELKWATCSQHVCLCIHLATNHRWAHECSQVAYPREQVFIERAVRDLEAHRMVPELPGRQLANLGGFMTPKELLIVIVFVAAWDV